MISSFRRNLQAEHLSRLIDLAILPDSSSPSIRTIRTLAKQQLRDLAADIEGALGESPDPYTKAHLADCHTRIEKALDAAYTINSASPYGMGGLFMIGAEPKQDP